MRRLNSPVRCHLRFQLDHFVILLPWMCGLVCLVFLRSGNSETIILGSYSLWEVRTSKHAKQLTFSECVFYKWYFFFFPFICTVVLLTCHHSDWGEKSCHFIIYSLSTYRSSCFPPFLSVFERLSMSHFSVEELTITFFFRDSFCCCLQWFSEMADLMFQCAIILSLCCCVGPDCLLHLCWHTQTTYWASLYVALHIVPHTVE